VTDAAPPDPANSTDPLAAFRLDGRVAIVTGASSGLGRRFAAVLHGAGARVVVAARRADRLDELVARLPGAVAVPGDVTDDADRQQLVDRALELDERIDVLVNNAGVSMPLPAEDEPLDQFRQVVEVNLHALFGLSQLVGRQMLGQGQGSIVNIASVLGLVAAAPIKQASYTASKGAVVNLTRQMGAEWGRRGVRVNAIAPGWFETEMTTEMWSDTSSMAYIRRNTPMGRPGRLDELDGALLFLAGDASSFVTGQTLAVDGGWTSR
jgi:NAD(P)-dependent dehydrogenase (short-subunit alcohol dehydrogenase family)